MAATAPAPTPEPVKPTLAPAPKVDETPRFEPRYADGALETKFLAEQTDLDNLEDSNFYLSYDHSNVDGPHKASYHLRSSFNNKEKGLHFWFADAQAKLKTKDSAWAARAILSPGAYFMANYQHHFGHGLSLRLGGETELGKGFRHFWKLRKQIDSHRVDLIVSGPLGGASAADYVDSVSLVPKFVLKNKNPDSHVKKVKVGVHFDLSVHGKEIVQKDDVKLATRVKLREGVFRGDFFLGRALTFESDLSFYHKVHRNLGLYLNYVGSLRRFDGVATAGFQATLPEFGKVRTSLNSHFVLKNSFIYNVHPFASLVQYTHFNVKERSDLHFGLGLALGN